MTICATPNRLRHDLSHILDGHWRTGGVVGIVEHAGAEGAAQGQGVGAGGLGLGVAIEIDRLGAVLLLLPHLRPARPAAEGVALAAVHLQQGHAGLGQRLAGFGIDPVVATQVTGVVEGYFFQLVAVQLERPVANQLRNELGVMQHGELPAQGSVLLADGVQAVGAVGDNLLLIGPDAL